MAMPLLRKSRKVFNRIEFYKTQRKLNMVKTKCVDRINSWKTKTMLACQIGGWHAYLNWILDRVKKKEEEEKIHFIIAKQKSFFSLTLIPVLSSWLTCDLCWLTGQKCTGFAISDSELLLSTKTFNLNYARMLQI